MCNPAASLLGDFEGFSIRETDHFIIALLLNKLAKVYGSAVNSYGRTCLQTFGLKADFFQLFRDTMTGYLSHSAAWEMLFPDMD